MSRKADAQATLDRWEDRWSLKVRFDKAWPLGWIAVWAGPRGGNYRMWHPTLHGAQRRVTAELARWTRKRRQIAERRRQARSMKGLDILR